MNPAGLFSTINESTTENSTTFACQSRYIHKTTTGVEDGSSLNKRLRNKRYTALASPKNSLLSPLQPRGGSNNAAILHLVDYSEPSSRQNNGFSKRHHSLLPSMKSPINQTMVHDRPKQNMLFESNRSPPRVYLSPIPSSSLSPSAQLSAKPSPPLSH